MKNKIMTLLVISLLSGCKYFDDSSTVTRIGYDVNCTIKETTVKLFKVDGSEIPGYLTEKNKEPFYTSVSVFPAKIGESGYMKPNYITIDWDDKHEWIKSVTFINPITGNGRVDYYSFKTNSTNRIARIDILENCYLY